MIAVGVMSGTSCDGIDAIAIRLKSVSHPHEPEVLTHAYRPYSGELRARLLQPDTLRMHEIAELGVILGEQNAEAVRALGLPRIDVCGMHGQTLFHAPPSTQPKVPSTLQIGSTAIVSARLGVPVVGDIRLADIALGGEGAPLVPFAHWFFSPPSTRPRLVVNIGGIANASWVTEDPCDVLGFDVGPGMMLVDAYAEAITDGRLRCDLDGKLSAGGSIEDEVLAPIVEHPYLKKPPPKSTGRELFGRDFFSPLFERWKQLPRSNVAYTLAVATSRIIERTARDLLPSGGEILLTGGGARHPVLVSDLAQRLPESRVTQTLAGVFAASHHEPAAMALIAARTLCGLPSSLPHVTGATRSAVLGHIHFPP